MQTGKTVRGQVYDTAHSQTHQLAVIHIFSQHRVDSLPPTQCKLKILELR